MARKKPQTETLQSETPEQLVNGKSVVDPAPDYLAALLVLLGDKIPKKTRMIIGYKAAKEAGIKLVFLMGNRMVYSSQVQALSKSAKANQKFTDACHIVPLKPILEKYPGTEAYDLDGNKVTLESPDIDLCFAVYDGQHRIVACELHPGEIDVDLEFFDFDGTNPLEEIKQMNSFSRNWNCSDLRTSNINAGLTNNQLYEEAEKLQNLYGITPKLAEYTLTFKREATKKKDLIAGKDTTSYIKENGDRGHGIINVSMMKFNCASEIKKLQFMDAIVATYDSLPDDRKKPFARNMKLYIGNMNESVCSVVIKHLSDKNYGELNDVIKNGYNAFCEKHPEEDTLIKMESEIDKEINTFICALQNSKKEASSKKYLKSGYAHDIIKHNIKVAKAKAQAKLEQSKKRADKAQKDYEEANDKINKLNQVSEKSSKK